jgi:hypothetical protein
MDLSQLRLRYSSYHVSRSALFSIYAARMEIVLRLAVDVATFVCPAMNGD